MSIPAEQAAAMQQKRLAFDATWPQRLAERTGAKRNKKPDGAYVGKESSFQASAIKLIRSLAPNALIVHIPNGRNAGSARMGGFWKAQGVVSGMPDIMVFSTKAHGFNLSNDGQYSGIGIELKVWPRKCSPQQLEVHAQLSRQDWLIRVCYGLDEVERFTREYFTKR